VDKHRVIRLYFLALSGDAPASSNAQRLLAALQRAKIQSLPARSLADLKRELLPEVSENT